MAVYKLTIWLFGLRVRRTAKSTHRRSNRRDRRQHWQAVCQTIGAALGPIGTGRIYDLMGSHSYAFDLFVIACILGALATLGSLSLESEQSRLMQIAVTAA